MKKLFSALAAAIIGLYAGFCLFIMLSLAGIIVSPLRASEVFNPTLTALTLMIVIRIFIVQMRKPSS